MMPRRGFTLTELLVAIVLLALVGTAIMTLVVRQQRFYVGTSQVIETRSNVRQIADLLPTELRALSPASDDIYAMNDASIEFRSIRGASIICNRLTTTTFVIPPVALSRRNGLSSWAIAPAAGDSIMIFDVESSPRQWHFRRVSSVGTGTCLAAADFGASVAENAAGLLITIDEPMPASIINGAGLRIYRRAKYELYQASDNQWYLGYRDCQPFRVTPCEALQPVSGPYLPKGDAAASGLFLRYFDRAGIETASAANVARIDVVARAASRDAVRRFEGAGEVYRDSIAFSIAVRN